MEKFQLELGENVKSSTVYFNIRGPVYENSTEIIRVHVGLWTRQTQP